MKKLEALMVSEGQNKYRATQLFIWLYDKKATSFEEMSDISKSFREVLKEKYTLILPKIYTKQISEDGTIKLLLEMEDGMKVETVLMRYSYGNSVCVSSQVGCSMGCSFCSSGLLGKQRNLTAAEMVGEVMIINNLLKEYLVDEQLETSSMVILVDDMDFFTEFFSEGIAKWSFVNGPSRSDDEIRVSTVADFKGLESDMIIYIHGKNVSQNLNYIAYTRAKYYLLELVLQ